MRWISIAIFCSFLISSCANVLRFEKDNLVAFGEKFNGSQEPVYYLIRIDMTKTIENQLGSIFLKISPDRPPIVLTELSPELVAQYLHPFIPPPQWPDRWKLKAKEEEIFAGGGFYIKFKNGQLLFVDICSHCNNRRENPIVATPDGHHFYTLPLTEQQIIEIFGFPKRIIKVNEVRY